MNRASAPRRSPLPMNETRVRMVMRFLLPATLCLSAIMTPAILTAQDPSMYRVELVLFRHTDPDAPRSEVWRSGEVERLDEALDLAEPDGSRSAPATLFRDAAGTPFGLRGIVTRLEQSPLYEVIASYAWEQPGLAQADSVPVRIRTGRLLGRAAPAQDPRAPESWRITPVLGRVPTEPDGQIRLYEVDGTITLSLARFLHLQTDLLYRRPGEGALPGDSVWTLEGNRLVESRANERRRMRSSETHYLDHPLMGIIVRVTSLD